jgi:hypothetical protein
MENEGTKPDITASVDVKTPITVAVRVSLALVVFVVGTFIALGGSFLIGISNKNEIKANEQTFEVKQTRLQQQFEKAQGQLHIRELESSVRTAIPTCRALIKLDSAKDGASNASKDPNSYGHRLATDITGVVKVSHCRTLVRKVDAGVPLLKIAQQEEKQADASK